MLLSNVVQRCRAIPPGPRRVRVTRRARGPAARLYLGACPCAEQAARGARPDPSGPEGARPARARKEVPAMPQGDQLYSVGGVLLPRPFKVPRLGPFEVFVADRKGGVECKSVQLGVKRLVKINF